MNNIFPSPSSISTTDRHLLNGHSGGLLWFTGLSGSGKSTLAHAVEEKLHSLCVCTYVNHKNETSRAKNLNLEQDTSQLQG